MMKRLQERMNEPPPLDTDYVRELKANTRIWLGIFSAWIVIGGLMLLWHFLSGDFE